MAAEGWYPDPAGTHALRWHDGAAWTAHVVEGSRRVEDPAGAPSGDLPEPRGDARWLPPPSLPDTPSWGPFRAGMPSGGPGAVPAGGYEPVLTGNRALDLTQNYVNEFESQLRRDASLLQSAAAAVRAVPALKRLGIAFGTLAVLALVAVLAGLFFAFEAAFTGGTPLLVLLFVPVLAVVLAVIYVLPSVLCFAAGVAAGLSVLGGATPRTGDLLRAASRAWKALGTLALARFAWWRPGLAGKSAALLYEAFAVFVVPVAIERRAGLREAQRESEELVAERWGPGRFRALGLPQTSPWSVVYTRGVTQRGYKAPYLSALKVLALLLGPLLIALATGNTVAIVATFAWTWIAVAFGGLVWSAVAQPLLQGMLRAHLYHYARTGKAAPPFDEDALHACLREEARARFGLPQRRSGARRAPPLGVTGVARSFAADPAGYVAEESGLTPADVKQVIGDARRLYKDGKLVTRALRNAPLDAPALVAATGLPEDRCRMAVVNLLWSGGLAADVSPGGDVRYSLAR